MMVGLQVLVYGIYAGTMGSDWRFGGNSDMTKGMGYSHMGLRLHCAAEAAEIDMT